MIHTDFERGFIRAQTIAFDDFIRYKGEAGAKEAGKMRPKAKEYVVGTGDVLNFLFNVAERPACSPWASTGRQPGGHETGAKTARQLVKQASTRPAAARTTIKQTSVPRSPSKVARGG